MVRTALLLVALSLCAPAFAERYVVLFRKGPAWDETKPAGEQQHFADHSRNLQRLRTADQLLLGTRYGDVGMVVLTAADEASARAEIDQDPSVRAGVFAYEIHPARFFYEPLGAPSTRALTIQAPIAHLPDAQRVWLRAFEAAAPSYADKSAPAFEWLASSAQSAREAGLGSTADYLAAAASVLRGASPAQEMEQAFRRTLDAPLHVMLRVADAKLLDVVVAVPNLPESQRASRTAVDAFEKTLPGFQPGWIEPIAPDGISRVATLRLRAGRAVASTSPASYLPFDRSLNASVGRTWIVYDNVLPQVWFGADVRPVVQKLAPSIAPLASGDALLRWYALRTPAYDIGRNLTPAELDRFGADKDALRIAKADLFCTLAAGASDADFATLAAITLQTLLQAYAGTAPPPHRTASAMLVNYAVEREAMRFDREKNIWSVDLPKLGDAVRALAYEILTIEAALDTVRARELIAKYGATTPDIDRSVVLMAQIPKTTVTTKFAAAEP